jgi:hypothetical protein
MSQYVSILNGDTISYLITYYVIYNPILVLYSFIAITCYGTTTMRACCINAHMLTKAISTR